MFYLFFQAQQITQQQSQQVHQLTGKSFSEALILRSVNPQYDERLSIEFPYKITKFCVQLLFWMSKHKQNKKQFFTQHVVNLYFGGNSMNNLLSYCGLVDAKIRTSDKDLPVQKKMFQFIHTNLLMNIMKKCFSMQKLIKCMRNSAAHKGPFWWVFLWWNFPEKWVL